MLLRKWIEGCGGYDEKKHACWAGGQTPRQSFLKDSFCFW